MVPCKTGDLDPVTTLVAPLVFAVGSKVEVSGQLGLQPEGSLVLCVQHFLGESWSLYLLLWAPGSLCHLKHHVMGHQGVFHSCKAKVKSLRSVSQTSVPHRHHCGQSLLSPSSLPTSWTLSTSSCLQLKLLKVQHCLCSLAPELEESSKPPGAAQTWSNTKQSHELEGSEQQEGHKSKFV